MSYDNEEDDVRVTLQITDRQQSTSIAEQTVWCAGFANNNFMDNQMIRRGRKESSRQTENTDNVDGEILDS